MDTNNMLDTETKARYFDMQEAERRARMPRITEEIKHLRHRQFKVLVGELGATQGVLALWLELRINKQTREVVSQKYRGARTVTGKDLALLNAMTLLQAEGYDLGTAKFTDAGELFSIEKKGIE